MKQKLLQVGSVLLLFLFSCYYTNKSIDIIRESDPIMRQIKSNSEKFKVDAVDADIQDTTIVPGVNGVSVDYHETYKKMKKYGSYNESLTVFEDTSPNVSIEDYYDKYITSGNKIKKNIALVFKVNTLDDITNISNILIEKDIVATFFIDGLWMENNLNIVQSMNRFELEILSYDNKYDEVYFYSSVSYLENNLQKDVKYCYAEYDKKEVIELCSKLHLHTIIPTIKIGNYPYQEIKQKLDNAAIISLPINTSTEIELPTVIDYIKQKGFGFVSLDTLLSETVEK